MGLFGKVFKKNEHHSKKHFPKGFYKIPVFEVVRLTDKCVKVVFDVPADLKEKFSFIPGQYINIIEEIIRLHGYEHIKEEKTISTNEDKIKIENSPANKKHKIYERLKKILASENYQEIIVLADAIYEKSVAFLDNFQEIGKALKKADDYYVSAQKKLVEGKGNLVEKLQTLKNISGISSSKKIPESLL